MELKKYQQETLNDLNRFLERLRQDNNLQLAYRNYWLEKGIDISDIKANRFIHSYDNAIKGVPRVMFKVPTAGGKTFIAANSLNVIFRHLPSDRPKVVVWFVPSDSILRQTFQNLSNPYHPYRQCINSHFNNRVAVIDKETALSGTGIQPDQMKSQLTLFVFSVQSFAANNKEGRRVYRENASLAAYSNLINENERIKDADETSLIQTIANLNPVVIIDESHNFNSDMRVDVLNVINPCFILDLTATPREHSNIISFVDAKKLKDEHMVKLPIILYNRDNVKEVIYNAITLRQNLEERAMQQRKAGGRYIRPIVLLQAEPKGKESSETFEKVKESLIKTGIKPEHIKIKTATIDELKNIDLMSEDCEVRYIITVNALKEGWDCPFAYILASLANKTSQVDVEQIVGRVLRLPYAHDNEDEYLNCSYVFTSSINFSDTVQSVIKGLNNAGFSSRDTRLADTLPSESRGKQPMPSPYPLEDQEMTLEDLFDAKEPEEFHDSDYSYSSGNMQAEEVSLDETLRKAHEANQQYEQENAQQSGSNLPQDMANIIKQYAFKEQYKEIAQKIQVPQFVIKMDSQTIFNDDSHYGLLTKSHLTEGFNLETQDKNISFESAKPDVAKIDLEERSENEFVPKQYKLNESQLTNIRNLFESYNVETKRKQLAQKIALRLNFIEINEPHISNYILSVLSNKNDDELLNLFNHELQTTDTFKRKIDSLLADYQHKKFRELLDKGKIECCEHYCFPATITPSKTAIGIPKGLYLEEDGNMNNFELKVITEVANYDNVLFWHRNPERTDGSFHINGFINHYPDFIILTKRGTIILLETKGDDRDNSDSKLKIELGNAWANKAGNNYRYFLVFQNTQFENAYTTKDFLNILKDL